MLSTLSSLSSAVFTNKLTAIPITLNTTNPNGAGNLGFWQLTNTITSKGITADDANYGSSVCVSQYGQISAWCRATTTTNKFYSGNLNDGTMYERNITGLGFNTGCQAYNMAMAKGSGKSIIIISVKSTSNGPYAISFNGGASFTKITSVLTGATNLYPDMAITDDGTYMYCVGFNNGYGNAYSLDGVNWTSISSTLNFQTYSCSLSSTTGPFFACCTSVSGNSRYTTTAFSGSTSGWTQYYQSPNPSLSQATSDSGDSIILCSAGQVRYSNNAKATTPTITNVTSSSAGTITYVSQSGQRATMSIDGTRMAFVATSASQYDCVYSTNSGSNWTSINTQFSTNIHFTSCNFTQDGKKLVCLANEGLYMLELP